MRLPGQQDLHGAIRVGEDPQQPLAVAEEEVRSLVGRETPREPEGQQ